MDDQEFQINQPRGKGITVEIPVRTRFLDYDNLTAESSEPHVGHDYAGKNGTDFGMNYSQSADMHHVLEELTGTHVELEPSSEKQCREWARLLRKNIESLKVFRIPVSGIEMSLVVVKGQDLRRLASMYGMNSSMIKSVSPEPLDQSKKEFVLEFADFLESCGGIVGGEQSPR